MQITRDHLEKHSWEGRKLKLRLYQGYTEQVLIIPAYNFGSEKTNDAERASQLYIIISVFTDNAGQTNEAECCATTSTSRPSLELMKIFKCTIEIRKHLAYKGQSPRTRLRMLSQASGLDMCGPRENAPYEQINSLP